MAQAPKPQGVKVESQKGHIAPSYESNEGTFPKKDSPSKSHASQTSETMTEPPKEYERIIQKLEADIRGHIRLEHEMKIHMDYLEGKCEEFERFRLKFEAERRSFA